MVTIVHFENKKCTGSKKNLEEFEVMVGWIKTKRKIGYYKEEVVNCWRLMEDGSCDYNGKCKYHPTRLHHVNPFSN